MKYYLTAGEVADAQRISKQTVLYYDSIGLFTPSYIDRDNGYRYYSSDQLDRLDTILMLKKSGLSLKEIKEEMKDFDTEAAVAVLKRQLKRIDNEIDELKVLKDALRFRIVQVEDAMKRKNGEIVRGQDGPFNLYVEDVPYPYSIEEVTLATKNCIYNARKAGIQVHYIVGCILPLEKLYSGAFTETTKAFLPCDNVKGVKFHFHPKGEAVSIYHRGSYENIGESYKKLLQYCKDNKLEIISDSYEFALNDFYTTTDEKEFITKLTVFVRS